MSDVLYVLVFLPAAVVWVLAIRDALTRKDLRRRTRVLLVVALGLFFPLTVVYLLGRPPSSVRRGPEASDDPRTALLEQLESPAPSSAEVAALLEWVGPRGQLTGSPRPFRPAPRR